MRRSPRKIPAPVPTGHVRVERPLRGVAVVGYAEIVGAAVKKRVVLSAVGAGGVQQQGDIIKIWVSARRRRQSPSSRQKPANC